MNCDEYNIIKVARASQRRQPTKRLWMKNSFRSAFSGTCDPYRHVCCHCVAAHVVVALEQLGRVVAACSPLPRRLAPYVLRCPEGSRLPFSLRSGGACGDVEGLEPSLTVDSKIWPFGWFCILAGLLQLFPLSRRCVTYPVGFSQGVGRVRIELTALLRGLQHKRTCRKAAAAACLWERLYFFCFSVHHLRPPPSVRTEVLVLPVLV